MSATVLTSSRVVLALIVMAVTGRFALGQPVSRPCDPSITNFDLKDVELYAQTRDAAIGAAPNDALALYFDNALIASFNAPPARGRVGTFQRPITTMSDAQMQAISKIEVASWGPACAGTLNIPDSFYWGPRAALLLGRVGCATSAVRRDLLGVAVRFNNPGQKIWEPNPNTASCPPPYSTALTYTSHSADGTTASTGPIDFMLHSGAADNPQLLYQSTLTTVGRQRVANQNEMYLSHFTLPDGLSVRKQDLRSACLVNRGDDNWHPGTIALIGWGRDANGVLRGAELARNSWVPTDPTAWINQDPGGGSGAPPKQYACMNWW